MRKFVITGCGHSGTTYLAHVLRRCGVSCGHEDVFRPWAPPPADWRAYDGEASWFAAPYLAGLPDDVVVLHLWRDPAKVIGSFTYSTKRFRAVEPRGALGYYASRTLRRTPRNAYGFRQFVRRHTPEVFTTWATMERSARHWLTWNQLVEKGAAGKDYLRAEVTDVDEVLVREILDMTGVGDHGRVVDALEATSTATNSKQRKRREANLAELPDQLRAQVEAQVVRYRAEIS